MSDADWIDVEHRRVGRFRVRTGDLLHFEGVPGFPEARRFAFLRHDERAASEQPFSWLACVDDPDLAFPVTDPRVFVPGYDPRVPADVVSELGASGRGELLVLAIANLASDPPRLNLAAPLLVNPAARRGAQLILEDATLPLDQPVELVTRQDGDGQIESKPQT